MNTITTRDELETCGFFDRTDLLAAQQVARLVNSCDQEVLLALALVLRSARSGDVLVDLADLPRAFLDREGTVHTLDPALWPQDPVRWAQCLVLEPLLVSPTGPLVVRGTRLYLRRLFEAETEVVEHLVQRLQQAVAQDNTGQEDPLAWTPGLTLKPGFDLDATIDALLNAQPGAGKAGLNGVQKQGVQAQDVDQLAAVKSVVERTFTVISGGPGTGKTVTIAKALAILLTGFSGSGPNGEPVIKVAAFTGKAAARAKEALANAATLIEEQFAHLGLATDAIRAIEPTTIARLIGMGWGIRSKPKVNAEQPIEADVLVIDEVSMVSVGDLATILAGTSPHTHVVLVGDHNQLPSIEAGQVMADFIEGAQAAGAGAAMMTLRTNYRSNQSINKLAQAVLAGNPDRVWAHLTAITPKGTKVLFSPETLETKGFEGCVFVEANLAGPLTKDRVGEGIAEMMIRHRIQVRDLVDAGNLTEAVRANTRAVVLAVHQRGYGSREHWNQAMDRWIHRIPLHRIPSDWVGRPVMVTENDRHIGVVNGDVGIVVKAGEFGRSGKVALDGRFAADGQPDLIDLDRLRTLETVHAMTVHKSQGSEYETVVIMLPPSLSPLLSRELVYTAITRAKKGVVIVGSREALETAVLTGNRRASSLAERLTQELTSLSV